MQLILVGNSTAAQITTVAVQVSAKLDLCRLQASADLTDLTHGHRYRMVTSIPGGELAAVERFDQAIIKQEWATVYALSVYSDGGGPTESQFAAQMEQGIRTTGVVTDIKITSTPVVTVNVSVGETFFAVEEQVAYAHNGATKVASFHDLFVLADGMWKFFDSAPA